MPTTELDALTGVPARYRQVLTDDLHLASCRDLVLTERSVIQQAIRAAKKRATLEQIAEWQDDARRYHPTTSDNDPHPWDTTASFAVSFLQRHREDQSLERRIEVEHVDLFEDRFALVPRSGRGRTGGGGEDNRVIAGERGRGVRHRRLSRRAAGPAYLGRSDGRNRRHTGVDALVVLGARHGRARQGGTRQGRAVLTSRRGPCRFR